MVARENSDAVSVGVLVQDPHSLVREVLRVIIEQLDGAKVVAEAEHPSDIPGAAAISSADIILVDLSDVEAALPAIREVKAKNPSARMIGLAEETSRPLLQAALDAGVSGLALKTDSADDLQRALKVVGGGHSTVAPNASGPLLRSYLDILREKQHRDEQIIESLASAVDAKDRFTGGHTQRVTRLALALAEQMDPMLGTNPDLRFGFMLHDVGKIGVPEGILMKPDSLDESEWEIMKTHPIIGLQIIGPASLGAEVQDIVRHHHERWDGTGYPDNLRGEDIPLGARLFSVADSFDAMTNDRPYRAALPTNEAVTEIESEAGKQFDPAAVKGFLELLPG